MQFVVKVSDLGLDPNKARGIVRSGLAIFGRYFSRRVHQRFASEGPGWAPKKEATAASALRETRIKNLAEYKLTRKLIRQVKRAEVRLARGKGTFDSVARRKAVLEEYQRQLSGGSLSAVTRKKKNETPEEKAVRLSGRFQKSVAGLGARQARAEAAAASKILGRSEGSIYSKLSGSTYTLGSRIPWFSVQNEGGTAGHGAKIPARPSIFVEDADLEILAEILINRALKALS